MLTRSANPLTPFSLALTGVLALFAAQGRSAPPARAPSRPLPTGFVPAHQAAEQVMQASHTDRAGVATLARTRTNAQSQASQQHRLPSDDPQAADVPVLAGDEFFPPQVPHASCGECCTSPFSCGTICPIALWVRGEYLLWRTDPLDIPPLVTSSPPGTPAATAGILGTPGTTTLLGHDWGGSSQSGFRITAGVWLEPGCCDGFEASYFQLGTQTSPFTVDSNDSPILARPVIDTGLAAEAAQLVAHPDFLVGGVAVTATSELEGAEFLYRRRLFAHCGAGIDLLLGYRYGNLEEQLTIVQSTRFTAAQGAVVVGTTQELIDDFITQNQFHGGQVGFSFSRPCRCWSLEATGKIAFGNTHSEVAIAGQTTTTVPGGGSALFPGGLLAQPTNIGRYEQNNFSVVPEFAVRMERELACNLRLQVGYQLLYWTGVARPGDQIDRRVSQFPPEPPAGTLNPAFQFQTRGFLAHGLSVGLEYEF